MRRNTTDLFRQLRRISKRTIRILLYLVAGLIFLELLLRAGGFVYFHVKEFGSDISPSENTYRILALGESTTEDGGDYSWPAQLERILNDRSNTIQFRVYNRGVGGANTTFLLEKLKVDFDAYRPNMIITMMGTNDDNCPIIYNEESIVIKLISLKEYRVFKLIKLLLNSINIEMKEDRQIENFLKKHNIEYLKNNFENILENLLNEEEHYRLAEAADQYYQRNDLDLAEENAKRAIAKNPEQFGAYTILARIYIEKKEFKRAKEAYLMSISLAAPMDALVEIWKCCQDPEISTSEIEEIYREHGFHIKISPDIVLEDYKSIKSHRKMWILANELRHRNYNKIYEITKNKRIKYKAMNYPTRNIDELKALFNGDEDILFVSNEENFKEALENGEYEDYFIDRCYRSFGHATAKGNELIAENVAEEILKDVRK